MSFDEAFIRAAHKHCTYNRDAIRGSQSCGCFYCEGSYSASLVDEVLDEGTALCPQCGIDSVLPDLSGLPVTDPAFLFAMHGLWFGSPFRPPKSKYQLSSVGRQFRRLMQRLSRKKNANAVD